MQLAARKTRAVVQFFILTLIYAPLAPVCHLGALNKERFLDFAGGYVVLTTAAPYYPNQVCCRLIPLKKRISPNNDAA